MSTHLNVFIGEPRDVFEDEHQAADFIDQLGIFGTEAFHQRPFGRAIGNVEHLGHRLNAAGVLEALAHDARHAAFEALLDFANDLGVRAAHRRDAADDRDAALFRQTSQDFGAEAGRQVRHDQRDGLRMLIDNVGEQVLAINIPQEAEGHLFDRLPEVGQDRRGVAAERFLDERFRQFKPAAAASRSRGSPR